MISKIWNMIHKKNLTDKKNTETESLWLNNIYFFEKRNNCFYKLSIMTTF